MRLQQLAKPIARESKKRSNFTRNLMRPSEPEGGASYATGVSVSSLRRAS